MNTQLHRRIQMAMGKDEDKLMTHRVVKIVCKGTKWASHRE